MCMFSTPIQHVSGTRIFARMLDGEPARQVLIYAMRLGTAADVAMILPVPIPPGAGESALRFVSLDGYAEFFDALDQMFPPDEPELLVEGTVLFASRAQRLQVHRVGAFDASFVPDRSAFERLDPRFRLPADVMRALPYADDWGYAVFKLRADSDRSWWRRLLRRRSTSGVAATQAVHPMAFVFETRKPDTLFFPTVHVHDGHLPERAVFDHQLYVQAGEGFVLPGFGVEDGAFDGREPLVQRSRERLGVGVDIERARGLVDGELPAVRVGLRGVGRNRDVEIGVR